MQALSRFKHVGAAMTLYPAKLREHPRLEVLEVSIGASLTRPIGTTSLQSSRLLFDNAR